MNTYKQSQETISALFTHHDYAAISMGRLAHFAAREMSPAAIRDILSTVRGSTVLIDEVAARSYNVSPHFLKLMVHKDESGWGMRLHDFQPPDGQAMDEPWHEHRWQLASTVLRGAVRTENAFATLGLDDNTTDNETYLKYSVPDKAVVGSVRPRLLGECVLTNPFRLSLPAGTSYGHHESLAHRLQIETPTITAVVTSPDVRDEAMFIEPEELQFEERPVPEPLTADEVRQAIDRILQMLQNQRDASGPIPPSPMPDVLAVAGR